MASLWKMFMKARMVKGLKQSHRFTPGCESLEDRSTPAVVISAVGSPPGSPATVSVFDANSQLKFTLDPFPGFLGGVNVAVGDVDGDGTPDVIAGAGAGATPHVKVFSGATGVEFQSFYAFDPGFTGGVNVAAGDVDGDGKADIIVGAGAGADPHVVVFSGATGAELQSFLAFDSGFRGGVNVAAGDVDGDGKADVITGAGPGAGPHVVVFSGANQTVLQSFLAYDLGFVGGVNVAAGDINGDGKADVITGAGPGAGPHVKVFDGTQTGVELQSFLAYDPSFAGGVTVSSVDVTGDGKADIITSSQVDGVQPPKAFDGTTLAEIPISFNGLPASTANTTTAPTATLTTSATNPTSTSPISFTVTFDRGVSGFSAAGVVVANGTVSNFTATSGTTYTFDVTPSAAGTVTVSIPAGVATDAAGNANAASTPVSLTFTPGSTVTAPTITGISPTSGSTGGGTSVVITGTGFTGATAVIFGTNTGASFVVNSDTQITVTAPAGTGIVPVTVTAPGGVSNSLPYTYVAGPVVASLNPTAGPVAGGTSVVITGTGFTGATAVNFGATAATSFVVNSNTQITAVAPPGAGTVGVTVTTPTGTSNGVNYTYAVAPTVASLNPSAGPVAGGTSVVITGTGFTGATAVNFGATAATSFVVNSDTQITAVAPAGTGTVGVTVTTAGGTSNGVNYTYVAAPTVTNLSPDTGAETGGETITITGTGFTGVTAVNFGGVPVSFTFVSDTQISVEAPAGTGTVGVTVTTPGGVSNSVNYTYVAVPTVASLNPDTGAEAGGETITITGTGFTTATAVNFGATAASFTVDSDTQITVTAPAGTGMVSVTVTTAGGTSNGVDYTYAVAPTLDNINPTSGPAVGGTEIVITGTGLTGATAVTVGGVSVTSFNVDSDTQITAIVPAGTAGPADVVVTTPGGNATAVGAFTYIAAPTVTNLNPDTGSEAGGETITITGTGFTTATAVNFGATAASFTVDSDTQITVTAPAGTGMVSVTVTTAGGTSNGVDYTYEAA